MSSSSGVQQSASVVELSAFRVTHTRSASMPRSSAELLSVRQSLAYEASVEIDDLDSLSDRLDPAVITKVKRRVRRLLDREFGRLRVHRDNRHFVARHRSVDALIAGLLRVQFHARQIRLPETDQHGERIERSGVGLTWGVGQCCREAELERLRRRGKS